MIRKAIVNDAVEIAKLDEMIFEDSLGFDFIESDLKNNPFANYFVYEVDGKIVAYIIFWVADNTSILNFGVLKEYRKQGIGSLLFDEVLKVSEGIISLEVRESNVNAINFYLKRGFKAVGVRENYYSNGENAYLMIRM
jgi:ribosomal-protein-alanine N-acetyltransferase